MNKIPKVRVQQFHVANQFVVCTEKGNYFQSYNSMIVFTDKQGNTWLDEDYWDYSNTTRKYRNRYLGESSSEIKNKIDRGIYKLTNLNGRTI